MTTETGSSHAGPPEYKQLVLPEPTPIALKDIPINYLVTTLQKSAAETFKALQRKLDKQNGNTKGISFSEEIEEPRSFKFKDEQGKSMVCQASQSGIANEIIARREKERVTIEKERENHWEKIDDLSNKGQPFRDTQIKVEELNSEIEKLNSQIKSVERLVNPKQRLDELKTEWKKIRDQRRRMQRAEYYANKNHGTGNPRPAKYK